MKAEEWDARYRASELIWGAGANRWVAQETADLPPGRALDLACGEGRNAIWLARRGWRVTAVDFSPVAIEKARTLSAGDEAVEWVCADALTYRIGQPVDLVLMIYLQLVSDGRREAMARAVAALAPGATLLVVGHDSANLTEGVGGPQDPAVLFTAQDIAADLAALDPAVVVDRADALLRPVDGADRPAIDALLRAHRPH